MTKVALVTGGGSGIGRACAIALGDAGFSVVVCGRKLGPLEETAAQAGRDAAALVCDVGDPGAVDLGAINQQRLMTKDAVANREEP